ncbi:MAG TPA: ChaN family lipoprotein, partial [Polyangiaceae bacterium LLY-WYZ-14_1]|nr:ChaN family lipoprotein [Polyangiaceae bacterium LLY-WYZ-14_1]
MTCSRALLFALAAATPSCAAAGGNGSGPRGPDAAGRSDSAALAERRTDLPPGHPSTPERALPPGHPPVRGRGELPPGHPPVRGNGGGLPPGHPPVRGDGGELPPGHPPVDEDRPSLDAPGPMAEAWKRPYILLDGRTGRRLDQRALVRRLAQAQVIYVGEKHDRPAHHQVQLEVIDRVGALGPAAVGLEMVQRPFQAALDAYAIDGDEDALLAGTEWTKRWGYDFRLYRPILRHAAQAGMPLVALNARREITRAVAREGPEGLDPELEAELPELDLDDVAHRARVRLVWAEHVGPHGGLAFENFYAAQVIWDETM